jgi:hypothetical protein
MMNAHHPKHDIDIDLSPDLDEIDGLRHCGALHHHHHHTDNTENTKKEADIELPDQFILVLPVVYPELHRIDSIRRLALGEMESRNDRCTSHRHLAKAEIQIPGHPVKDSPFLIQERHRQMNALLPKNYKI